MVYTNMDNQDKISLYGVWKDDKCLSGTMLYANKSIYEGEINLVYQKHGFGTEYHDEIKEINIKFKGKFENDNYQTGKATEQKVQFNHWEGLLFKLEDYTYSGKYEDGKRKDKNATVTWNSEYVGGW